MLTLITPNFSKPARYAFAILIVIVAALLRGALTPALGEREPFIIFYPGLVLSAWFGGFWPGVLSTVLSAIIAWNVFIPPVYSFAITEPGVAAQIIIFLVSGTFMSVLAESLHQAMRNAQKGEMRERDARERYRVTLASIGDAVLATDAEGRVTFMNHVAESLTG